MARLDEMLRARIAAMARGTRIERLSEDADVREWLVLGRIAMFVCLWAAIILPIVLLVSFRF